MNKSKFQILEEAQYYESIGAKRLLKAIRSGQPDHSAHQDFDQALERWLVVFHDLPADWTSSSKRLQWKFENEFRAGIEREVLSTRSLCAFRIAATWTLGTRTISVTVRNDHFPVEVPGDYIVRALLSMVNPWGSNVVLGAIDREVGEELNAYFLDTSPKPAGVESLAEMVLLARDYMFRSEYMASLDQVLETRRAKSREDLFRPTMRTIVDLFYLVTREVIEFGPAVQSPFFTRENLRSEGLGLTIS